MPYSLIRHTEIKEQQPFIISTAKGTAMLEIQGELNLPTTVPNSENDEPVDERFVSVDESNIGAKTQGFLDDLGVLNAVKFGKLEIQDKKATLYIGTSQRLLGEVKEVKPPLALLKFNDDEDGANMSQVEIVDVIRYKVIFTGRPLPIM